MLTKGIIVKLPTSSEENTYIVRIPYLENAGKNEEYLEEAVVSSISGLSNCYAVDDVVILDFEENNISKPIILGRLYVSTNEGTGFLSIEGLEIKNEVKLPENTSIGNVTPENIKTLIGQKERIRWQLDDIERRLGGGVQSNLPLEVRSDLPSPYAGESLLCIIYEEEEEV